MSVGCYCLIALRRSAGQPRISAVVHLCCKSLCVASTWKKTLPR